MFDLTGKKALVTGGSRGIGEGIVLALAKQGADVAIAYHNNQELAEKVVAKVNQLGRKALAVKTDISSAGEVKKMFALVREKWGKLDILVNNAGIVEFYDQFENLTEDHWDKVLGTNLKGQYLCAKEAVSLMGKGSKIINIASIASGGVGVGFVGIADYTASKGGVVAFSESLALDLAPKGINVNAVAPGVIESDMTKDMLSDEKQKQGLMARIPKKRAGKPEDIGAAVAFLASDEADYITGAVLYVDGGWLAN